MNQNFYINRQTDKQENMNRATILGYYINKVYQEKQIDTNLYKIAQDLHDNNFYLDNDK